MKIDNFKKNKILIVLCIFFILTTMFLLMQIIIAKNAAAIFIEYEGKEAVYYNGNIFIEVCDENINDFPQQLTHDFNEYIQFKKGDLRVEKVTCLQLNNIWSYLPLTLQSKFIMISKIIL